jgi:hypothetical protein
MLKQFSTRELLLVTLIVALSLGWAVRTKRQKEAIEDLRNRVEIEEAIQAMMKPIEPIPFKLLGRARFEEILENSQSERAGPIRESAKGRDEIENRGTATPPN